MPVVPLQPAARAWLNAAIVAAFSCTLAVGRPVTASDWTGSRDLPADPAVLFEVLTNGVHTAIMPHREPRGRVSLRLAVRAGSLQERQDQRGLAHYLEHMAFKGTENFAAGTLVEYFQNLGMSFGPDANAYTGFDRTVYQIELPDTETESVSDALRVLRDFVGRMRLEATEVESERGVILSEKRTRDSVRFRTALAEFAFLLPEAIVSDRFPIGAETVLQSIGRSELLDFYDAWYRPEHIAVIMVGDFDRELVRTLPAEHFTDFTARQPMPAAPILGQVSRHGLSARLHTEPEAPHTRVALQSVQPYEASADTVERRQALLIRSAALHMLSRRLDVLAQAAEAPFSRGTASAYDLFDFFTNASIDLITRPEDWPAALTLAEQELRRALQFGFQEAELREVRANLLNAFEENVRRAPTRSARDLAEALVAAFIQNTVFSDPETELELMRPVLESMTAAQCHAALNTAFPDGNRFIFLTGNVRMDDPETAILEVYRKAAADAVEPPAEQTDRPFAYPSPAEPGIPAETRHIPDLDIYTVRFANQVHLNFKITDFTSNQIMLAVRIGGGQLTEPPDRPGLAWMASQTFIRGGLGAHSADALRRLFAGRNVGWTFAVEPDAFVFRGVTTAADLPLQLQLLAAYLTDPGFREEALRRARADFAETVIAARHTAAGLLGDAVMKFLASDDPRFGLPSEDAYLSLSLEALRAWLSAPLRHDRLEISIVGDAGTPEHVIEAVAATLGALPERHRDKPDFEERRTVRRPAPGDTRHFPFESRIPSGFAAVYWAIPDIWDIERTRRLGILARVFTDRMRLRIRDDMGEAYSAYAVSDPSDTYRDYGWFYALVAVAPEPAGNVTANILDIASDLHSATISADEHQRALRPVLASLRDAVRENRYWLNSVLISLQEHPQRLDWARRMTADFSAITVDELNALAREYLDPEQAIRVFVIPRSTDAQ